VTISFQPRALLVTLPLVLLLWAVIELRWALAMGMAVLVYGVLEFAGVLGSDHR
jgi:hypothetical protein